MKTPESLANGSTLRRKTAQEIAQEAWDKSGRHPIPAKDSARFQELKEELTLAAELAFAECEKSHPQMTSAKAPAINPRCPLCHKPGILWGDNKPYRGKVFYLCETKGCPKEPYCFSVRVRRRRRQ